MNTDDPLKSVSLDFMNLLINGQAFSDVIFSVEGRQVHAHKCILAARSPFFRMIFCNSEVMNERNDSSCVQVIPVGVVGYEVFMVVLQFLYSGQACIAPQKQQGRSNCRERGCWHTHCTSAIDLALDTLSAAHFFSVDQLSVITQKQLASMVEKASIEDVTRVLMAARKQDLHYLWNTCSHLIARSGLPPEVLARHLPVDVSAKIEEIRLKLTYGRALHQVVPGNEVGSKGSMEDQRVQRMQRALDSSDVELVRLMVMGEGLNLDQALALHYAVANCSREVVKTLLELGAADVNHPSPGGRTALHIASEMVNPDMVSVLLDHHANPNIRTYSGSTPFDILQSLASDFLSRGGGVSIPHFEHNKLRLCLELLQSAALVLSREEETSTSLQLQLETSAAHVSDHRINNNTNGASSSSSSSVSAFAFTPVMQQGQCHSEISEGSSHLAALDSTTLFFNLTGQLACKDTCHYINPTESPRGR